VGSRALKAPAHFAIAAAAFLALFFLALPFPLVILLAAAIGLLGQALHLTWFAGSIGHSAASRTENAPALIDTAFARQTPSHVRPSFSRFVMVLGVGLAVWLVPLVLLLATLGLQNTFTAVAAFNAKMAVVTFGGAYAVLAYMAQQAVEFYHWLKPGEMLVGLGFAETTPGPLISVVQFVGFMAAFRHAGALNPYIAGTLGGALAMWMTFVPSFLWIFLGGPYIEALGSNKSLKAALTAITAAVVGVILNLAIWFGLHTLFARVEVRHAFGLTVSLPVLQSINLPALTLSVMSMIAIFRFNMGMLPVLAGASILGAGYYLLFGVP
jgi:chromate transporter